MYCNIYREMIYTKSDQKLILTYLKYTKVSIQADLATPVVSFSQKSGQMDYRDFKKAIRLIANHCSSFSEQRRLDFIAHAA